MSIVNIFILPYINPPLYNAIQLSHYSTNQVCYRPKEAYQTDTDEFEAASLIYKADNNVAPIGWYSDGHNKGQWDGESLISFIPCEVDWEPGEPYCEQQTLVCLSNMEIILRYAATSTPTSDGLTPICGVGTHTCNRASFYIQGNTTTIGNFSLNNGGGPEDLLNYPPGETSGGSRYNSLFITPEQALEMAEESTDGFITFKITPTVDNVTPHTGVTWLIFKLNGTIILQTCRDTTEFKVNPCTGEVIEL